MQFKYYPRIDNRNGQWIDIPSQTVPLVVGYPNNYDPTKVYPVVMTVHGIGERGVGTYTMLENFVKGFDFNGDGSREGAPFITTDMQKAGDDYGFIVICPTYSNFFEPAQVNWAFDFVRNLYSTVAEMEMIGFSYGGGAVLKYVTSTTANANRVAVAVPCAPTDNTTNDGIVGSSNLPMQIFVNERDDNGPTNLSVTRSIVNQLNASNPSLKVQYTAFDKNGHGGYNEATTIAPPVAPAGEGVVNISENIYQWYFDVLKSGPRQIKSGTTPTPNPNPDPIPTTLTAVAGVVVNGTIQVIDEIITESETLNFDGTKSTGYKSATWGATKVPTGVSPWANIFTVGGGWITSTAKFPKAGDYEITLTTKSATEEKKDIIKVYYRPTGEPIPVKQLLQKVFIPKNNNYVYVYDDGSTETKSS